MAREDNEQETVSEETSESQKELVDVSQPPADVDEDKDKSSGTELKIDQLDEAGELSLTGSVHHRDCADADDGRQQATEASENLATDSNTNETKENRGADETETHFLITDVLPVDTTNHQEETSVAVEVETAVTALIAEIPENQEAATAAEEMLAVPLEPCVNRIVEGLF